MEVRGEKTKQGIRFSWIDVSKMLEMEKNNLRCNLDKTEYEKFCPSIYSTIRQNRSSIYLSYNGILKIIKNSRSFDISKSIIFLNNSLIKQLSGVSIIIFKPCKEQQTVQAICEAFPDEDISTQYTVGPYRVDIYIKQKVVVECDEYGHRNRNSYNERERVKYIEKAKNCSLIMFNPDDPGFNLYFLIRNISDFLNEIKLKKVLKVKNKSFENLYREREELRKNVFTYQEREIEYKAQIAQKDQRIKNMVDDHREGERAFFHCFQF